MKFTQHDSLDGSGFDTYQGLMHSVYVQLQVGVELTGVMAFRGVLIRVSPAWRFFWPLYNMFNSDTLDTLDVFGMKTDFEHDPNCFGRKQYPEFFELADMFIGLGSELQPPA